MSTKWYSLAVAATTATAAVACGAQPAKKVETKKEETKKVETKKTTTTTTVSKGTVAKGTYKLGVVGANLDADLEGKIATKLVTDYSKTVSTQVGTAAPSTGYRETSSYTVGTEYLKLPSQLFLTTDSTYVGQNAAGKTYWTDSSNSKNHDWSSLALDTLFVQVKDTDQNSADWYKALVTDKKFKNTNVLMTGAKAKAQTGSSSKTFAGGKVSTATFNKYAAAYTAGFQAAVSQLAYSTDDKKFEETSVAFLVGSASDSESKKKAFAFYNGVKAAAAHADYAAYLKVKFVSKSADSSTSSKRLYRDIASWKSENKISQFTGSDTFQEGDRRVVYIAGAKARDWSGYSAVAKTGNAAGHVNKWANSQTDLGLTGAIYKTKASSSGETTGKTGSFSSGIQVVLDAMPSTMTNAHKIMMSGDMDSETSGVQYAVDNFNRYDVKLLGAIGKEAAGTKVFAKAYLKALYLGGYNYMLGKHVIFGSKMQTSFSGAEHQKHGSTADTTVDRSSGADSITKTNSFTYAFKAYDSERWDTAVSNSFSKELTEATITATSPWMK